MKSQSPLLAITLILSLLSIILSVGSSASETFVPTHSVLPTNSATGITSTSFAVQHRLSVPPTLPPAGQPYRDLTMSSMTDGWIVGEHGLIKRYMAGQWLDYPSPVTATLNAVAATLSDAWIVGDDNTILHLVNNSWQRVASLAPTGSSLLDVDIVAPNEVWVIGSPAVMLHYSGGIWSIAATPPSVGPISWASPDDAWMVDGTNVAYHYSADNWTSVPLYDEYGYPAIALSVFMLSPNKGWIGLHSETLGAAYATEYLSYDNVNGWQPWPTQHLCIVPSNCIVPSGAKQPTSETAPNCTQTRTDIYGLISFTTTQLYASSDKYVSDNCNDFQINYYLWRNDVSSNQRDINIGETYTHTFALYGTSGNDLWMLGNNAIRHWDGTNISVAPLCNNPFADVPSNYFALSQIEYLNCRGIVAVTDAQHFSPNASAQRSEFAKMISLARGWTLTTPSNGPTFSDVPPQHPLYAYVETAYQNGVISGASAADCGGRHVSYPCFLPNDPISRAQAVAITARAFGWPVDTSGGPHFSDVAPTYFAYNDIETAYHQGTISGIGGGLFAPNQNITRAQLARILYAALTSPLV